jgi:perosamine synthetase
VKVPLSKPSIGEREHEAKVLASGWLAHGDSCRRFEEAFAERIGVRHAVTLNSCTSGLELALKAHDILGEVIVPSFTFVASANAIVSAGARPVFCDVDRETRNVNAELIAPWISERTEAVMVVHYAGQPCPIEAIAELCAKHGLLLIEDSAETLGAFWKDVQAGSTGIGCFSFFPTKNIATGEGGMLTCENSTVFERVRTLAAHSVPSTAKSRENDARPWHREAIAAGHNYRMPDLLAALGLEQLLRLDELNARR